jgi:carboxyl-terminal processing protease
MLNLSLFRRGVKALGALSAGFALLLGLVVANSAVAEPRIALVIGNSAYQGDLPALPNPANDARLMAQTLKSIGFDVVEAEDASKDKMIEAIGQFRDKLLAAGNSATGLFFYAGHGLQVAGENYLIPVDAKIQAEKDVDLASVSANTVMKQMEFAQPAVNIIILDACRNNPLGDGARSMSRGLAKIETAPRGSFIAYSTAPGMTAADGDGVNSPYTKALAETITQPGLSIADVFQEVRTKVLASTGNEQTPWDSSSLTGRFYFKAPDATQNASVTPPAPATSAEEVKFKNEKAYWDTVKDSDDPDQIQLYLAKYPQGYFVEVANAKLEDLKGGTKVASAEPASDARESIQAPKAAPAAAPTTQIAIIGMPDQTIYASTSGASVRAAPSTEAAVLSKLSKNEEVIANGETKDGKWWRVRVGDTDAYISKKVASTQPVAPSNTAQAAQPQPAQPAQAQTLGAEAFEPVGAPQPAAAQNQGNDLAAQFVQGVAQQMGLPVNVPQIPAQQTQQQQLASSLAYNEKIETITLRAGAMIFDSAGGQPIYQSKQGGALLATARSVDGRWYRVSLPTGAGTGYVAQQWVVK